MGHSADATDRFVDTGESHSEKARLGQLFAPVHRRDTLVLSTAFFLVIFANLFVVSWAPSLLAELSYPLRVTSWGSAMWSLGGLIGAIVGAMLFARVGSRIALAMMMGGAVVVAGILCMIPLDPRHAGVAEVLGLLVACGTMVAGGQVMLFALAGQIYPTTIRATGVGFASAVGRIGAVLSGLAGPLLLSGGSPGFFGAVAVVMLECSLALLYMRSEVPPAVLSKRT